MVRPTKQIRGRRDDAGGWWQGLASLPVQAVRGWYIAIGQYSSLCEGAVVYSLDAVDIGEEVLVRVHVG